MFRAFTLAASLLIASPALAFTVQENWVGNQVRWEDSDLPVEWQLDSGNVPGGSGRMTAINQAIDAWNRTGGIRLLFTTDPGAENDNVMTEGDGKSEVLFTTRNAIDGAAGREFTTHNCAGCRRIVESDVAIANDIGGNPSPPTSQFTGCTAQAVLIHEFGHTIGLDHESNRLSMMQPICNDTPRVRGADGGHIVLPDDQQGARQQYAGNGDETNLIAISQYLFRELPQLYRDRYTFLEQAGIINPNAGNQRLVNLGLNGTRRAFNPDILECAAFGPLDPTCEGRFYDVAGPEPRALSLCPGDSFDVPFTVANRANSAGTEKAHSMGFYLTDGTDPPFDPTAQFSAAHDLAGAILDNEIEFDSTGSFNATGVQRLTLSNDPDCAPEGQYRLWHGVDICHEHLEGNGTVAAGGILEDDNFALTGFFVNIVDAGAAQCQGATIPASDGICPTAEIRKTCDAPPLDPPDGEPQPPDDCVAGSEDCVCQVTFGSLGSESAHPDGDHSINEFCPDDGNIERTCVSQGSFGLCRTCGNFGDRHVGCSCTSDDECGADLTCFGDETQNGMGTGTCQPEEPPSWVCQADCQVLFNDESAYCANNHPSGIALCVPGVCNEPEVFACWTEGELLDIDDQPTFGPVCRVAPDDSPLSASCRSECGPGADLDNPGIDVSCQDIGYPDNFVCDLQVAGGACRPNLP
ncbi:matrixin family metalloprotease [Sulfitobacter sp. BDSS02]|nr:matrixin family metalloprotease [Sulfitobacter sp. BDSS02]MBR9852090.1 matrixin family metalloprotease [Paracoccaceae bacterium]